jgi:hypothetical protein
MSRVQIQGGSGMKSTTKRVSSEALAHMLAVTAMLVIASILFYGNGETRRASAARNETVGHVSQGPVRDSGASSATYVDVQRASFSK